MNWCCHAAKNRFDDRNQYGEYLVAGFVPNVQEVWFFAGFNMAHRRDYTEILQACKAAATAIEEIGISNFKLTSSHCVHFCSHCGANLKEFYGKEGGALRDDEYVRQIIEGT